MLAGNTCAWVLFNQHLDLPHLSGGWLVLSDFNKCVLNIWNKELFCVHTKEKLYKIVYLNLWEKWEQQTKCCIYIFVYLMQYLQFVLSALKWAQNLAGLKLVINKLGVLWQPHWLCALYWSGHAMLVTSRPAPKHNICWSCWSVSQHPAGDQHGMCHQLISCCRVWGGVNLAVKIQYRAQNQRGQPRAPGCVSF